MKTPNRHKQTWKHFQPLTLRLRLSFVLWQHGHFHVHELGLPNKNDNIVSRNQGIFVWSLDGRTLLWRDKENIQALLPRFCKGSPRCSSVDTVEVWNLCIESSTACQVFKVFFLSFSFSSCDRCAAAMPISLQEYVIQASDGQWGCSGYFHGFWREMWDFLMVLPGCVS